MKFKGTFDSIDCQEGTKTCHACAFEAGAAVAALNCKGEESCNNLEVSATDQASFDSVLCGGTNACKNSMGLQTNAMRCDGEGSETRGPWWSHRLAPFCVYALLLGRSAP